jgi:hypothetical protein
VAAAGRDGGNLILRLRMQPRAPCRTGLSDLFGIARDGIGIVGGETGRDQRLRVRQPLKTPAVLGQSL